MAQISWVHQTNGMKYTTCFSFQHKLKRWRASWPMKDVNGSSFPPHGIHFRRLWEAAVKSMKCHLWCSLGALITTSEEICIFLSEKGACLNSKPLYALSNDPLDPSHLSPDLFVLGEPLNQLPSTDLTDCCQMSQVFQVADISTTTTTFLAVRVTRLLDGIPATSILVEIIPSSTRRCTAEGRQHCSSTLAHGCHHRCPSRTWWKGTSGHYHNC